MKRFALFVFAATLVFACTDTNNPVQPPDEQGPELVTLAAKPIPGQHVYVAIDPRKVAGMSWIDASNLSATTNYRGHKNGHLATISSEAENNAVRQAILDLKEPGQCWIGLRQFLTPTTKYLHWRWEGDNTYLLWRSSYDGLPTYQQDDDRFDGWVSYTNWGGPEPSNTQYGSIYEAYAVMGIDGKWNDLASNNSSPTCFVMEYEN